jgi:L-type amino acid transporter 5
MTDFLSLFVAGSGIYNICIGRFGSLENAFVGSSKNVGDYGVAFYTCMWSYGGWERVCQCFDEIKNPSKNIPIIIGVSISLVTVLYITVNIAYFTGKGST